MDLESQISELAALGLCLEGAVTADDLLRAYDRKEYEERPFDLLLSVLGHEAGGVNPEAYAGRPDLLLAALKVDTEREPGAKPFCRGVWSFDTECIENGGSYVTIINQLVRVAGASRRVTKVRASRVLRFGLGWVEYVLDGKPRRWRIVVKGDWADTDVVSHVMADLEAEGRRFYAKDNGQAMTLFFLDEATAARINRLSDNALKPLLSQ